MLDLIPRRLRFAFSRPTSEPETDAGNAPAGEEVDFTAYGEDCILSGRTVLDGDRLTDMLNEHQEYALIGVTVERFDDGQPLVIDDVVVSRDELFLVHASGPRGHAGRRRRMAPQHIAVKMGPYKIRGFFHGTPGTDAIEAMRRRKAMVPLTEVRIEFVLHGERRETRVETVIINRELVDWIEVVDPDLAAFPTGPQRLVARPKPMLADRA